MKSPLLIILLFTFSVSCLAQKRTLSGTVYDEEKNILRSANVRIKNSELGTITNSKGEFTIEVKADDVLEISYLGFKTKEIFVKQQQNIRITLANEFEVLDAAVVTGLRLKKDKTYMFCTIGTCYSEETAQKENYLAKDASFERILGEEQTVALYPNPSTNGIFQLQLNEKYAKLVVEIYCMNGKLIQSSTYTNLSKIPKIDLSAQAKGMYLVKVSADGAFLETKKAIRI